MMLRKKIKARLNQVDWHYTIVNFILIMIVVLIYGFAVWYGGYLHYTNNQDNKHEYHMRQQTISLINADRRERRLRPLYVSNKVQYKADKQAEKAYKVVNQQPKQSKYYIHTLHSNGYEVHSHRVALISKKLQHQNKTHKYNYLENCAEIGFGKRYYKNQGFHWQPYHMVRTNMGLSSLVNNHFMQYDQSKNNVHRKNILNGHIRSMGIAVIYNHKANHGVIVEEFDKRNMKRNVVR